MEDNLFASVVNLCLFPRREQNDGKPNLNLRRCASFVERLIQKVSPDDDKSFSHNSSCQPAYQAGVSLTCDSYKQLPAPPGAAVSMP